MTFITGPNLSTKSTPIIDGKSQEHVVEMRVVHGHGTRGGPPRIISPPFFILMGMTIFGIVGLGLLLYLMPSVRTSQPSRFKGYCTIPIRDSDDSQLLSMSDQPVYKVMPLRWTQDDSDVKVFRFESGGGGSGGGGGGGSASELVRSLREKFDIGDKVERISVMDNGKRVNFIHDFEQNTTGIEDAERCFTTELDRETVLPPELLMFSITDGAEFDVSRVRAALSAQLPALPSDELAPELRDLCARKPVYRLLRQEFNIIRKRSADAPSHDYIQFSGRRVQEIEISNLAEILQHEQDAANAQR